MEYNAKLTPLDDELISDATRYHQLVGSLIYLTVTRPNISHAVGMVSKFMDASRSIHYAAILQLLASQGQRSMARSTVNDSIIVKGLGC